MGLYLNPKMVEWFNEWQSTPDLLGMDLELQKELLILSSQYSDWDDINSLLSSRKWVEANSPELNSWLFFFISMYETEWDPSNNWHQDITLTQGYQDWLREIMGGESPAFGINEMMVRKIISNYDTNFIAEFVIGGHSWWKWNFVETWASPSPNYPLIRMHKTPREFEGILNWINEYPFEVKQ